MQRQSTLRKLQGLPLYLLGRASAISGTALLSLIAPLVTVGLVLGLRHCPHLRHAADLQTHTCNPSLISGRVGRSGTGSWSFGNTSCSQWSDATIMQNNSSVTARILALDVDSDKDTVLGRHPRLDSPYSLLSVCHSFSTLLFSV